MRIEATQALAGLQDVLPAHQRAAWQAVAYDFVATQNYNADRTEARVALGSFHARLGRAELAQAQFASARQLDPGFVPAWVNAADALRARKAARPTLRRCWSRASRRCRTRLHCTMPSVCRWCANSSCHAR